MLRRQDGEFYVFADPNQNLFGMQDDYLKRVPVSRHRLTRNLRNTASISEWVSSFVTEGKLRPVLEGGIPVVYHPWDEPAEEKRLIEAEAGRLVGQGIKLDRIVILSPDRLEKSCLAGVTCLRSWSLSDFRSGTPNSLRFATIRSFKGLEADIVLLIGLKEGKPACSTADVYVGGSRARYMLHVFHHRTKPPQGLVEVLKPVRQQVS
jgi:superfamily I DNA/RNA helicase